jgi:hypothetical protein
MDDFGFGKSHPQSVYFSVREGAVGQDYFADSAGADEHVERWKARRTKIENTETPVITPRDANSDASLEERDPWLWEASEVLSTTHTILSSSLCS